MAKTMSELGYSNDVPLLTLAFTTYNRSELICEAVRSLTNVQLPDCVEIIVIDNCSTDATFPNLSKIVAGTSIKLFQNSLNLGFAGNVFRVPHYASGRYVMWCSDKDALDVTALGKVIQFLNDKEPDSIVMNYERRLILKPGHISFIRKNFTRKIRSSDLFLCSHLPGIIVRRDLMQNCLLEKDQGDYPHLFVNYPNLIFLVRILPSRNSYFFNCCLTFQARYAPYSWHERKQGEMYSHVVPRWKQFLDLIKLIENTLGNCTNLKSKKYLKSMHRNISTFLFELMGSAIGEERPDLVGYYYKSASVKGLVRRNVRYLHLVIFGLWYNPRFTVRKILKRLK